MKIAVSSYSFSQYIRDGRLTQLTCIAKAKELGFDAIEFTDLQPPEGVTEEEYAHQIRQECDRVGLPVSNYTIGADLLNQDLKEEVERLKKKVDIAAILGTSSMRHDACWGWKEGNVRGSHGLRNIVDRLAEGCREGEFAVVEGIIEIEIQSLLRDFSLMDIYLATSHFLMTTECLGREIDHIKAIAVAIGIEVELKVLILASQLGWVYSQTKPQATISHSHGEGSTAVGHHLGMRFRSIRLRRSFQIGSRKIASQFDGPSGMRTGDVGSIILYLVIIGCQQ